MQYFFRIFFLLYLLCFRCRLVSAQQKKFRVVCVYSSSSSIEPHARRLAALGQQHIRPLVDNEQISHLCPSYVCTQSKKGNKTLRCRRRKKFSLEIGLTASCSPLRCHVINCIVVCGVLAV